VPTSADPYPNPYQPIERVSRPALSSRPRETAPADVERSTAADFYLVDHFFTTENPARSARVIFLRRALSRTALSRVPRLAAGRLHTAPHDAGLWSLLINARIHGLSYIRDGTREKERERGKKETVLLRGLGFVQARRSRIASSWHVATDSIYSKKCRSMTRAEI